jgi:hypothetical protein
MRATGKFDFHTVVEQHADADDSAGHGRESPFGISRIEGKCFDVSR